MIFQTANLMAYDEVNWEVLVVVFHSNCLLKRGELAQW